MVYGGGFCVVTGKVMILFLVLASHVKYMAGNLFPVWPSPRSRSSEPRQNNLYTLTVTTNYKLTPSDQPRERERKREQVRQ